MDVQFNDASFGKRFVAFLIDFIIMFFVGLIINFIFGISMFDLLRQANNGQIVRIPPGTQFILSLVSFAVSFTYYVIIAYYNNGATFGKLAVSIRVVYAPTYEPVCSVSFWRLAGREIIGKNIIGGCTCYITHIISIFMIINNGKSVHDSIFNTRVIDLNSPYYMNTDEEDNKTSNNDY